MSILSTWHAILCTTALAAQPARNPRHPARDPARLDYGREDHDAAGRLRRLSEANVAPLRVYVYTEQLQKDFSDVSDKTIVPYLVDDVLAATTRWLSQALRVRPVVGTLQLEQDCDLVNSITGFCWHVQDNFRMCGRVLIPLEHFKDRPYCVKNDCKTSRGGPGIPDADFALYATSSDGSSCSGDTIGYSGICHRDQYDRPVAGYMNFCKSYITYQGPVRWDTDVALTLHEITHALGFTSDSFAWYRDDNGQPRTQRDQHGSPPIESGAYVAAANTIKVILTKEGQEKNYVVLPRVVELARAYYNCSTMDGVPLEDAGSDGSANSHWDARVAYTELMAPVLETVPRLSRLTMAMLEESGWYKPDYSMAGPFHYGEGKGCDFLDGPCIHLDDKHNPVASFPDIFCTASPVPACSAQQAAGQIVCSSDLMAVAFCDMCSHSAALPSMYRMFPDPRWGGTQVYMDYCPVITSQSSTLCRNTPFVDGQDHWAIRGQSFGSNSRCIMAHAVQIGYYLADGAIATCHDIKCEEDKLFIRFGSQSVVCLKSEEGQIKSVGDGWTGDVTCPSHKLVCGIEPEYGPGNTPCLFPGEMRFGRCVCAPGYIGDDCSVEDTKAQRDYFPFGVHYSQTDIELEVGTSVSHSPGVLSWPFRPTVASGPPILRFSISPPLPDGLVIAEENGTLSGTPLKASMRTAHTLSAIAARGKGTATLFVTVHCKPGDTDCEFVESPTAAPTTQSTDNAKTADQTIVGTDFVWPSLVNKSDKLVLLVCGGFSLMSLQAGPGLKTFSENCSDSISNAIGYSARVVKVSMVMARQVQVELCITLDCGVNATEYWSAASALVDELENENSRLRGSYFGKTYLPSCATLYFATPEGVQWGWPKPTTAAPPNFGSVANDTWFSNFGLSLWQWLLVLGVAVVLAIATFFLIARSRRCRRGVGTVTTQIDHAVEAHRAAELRQSAFEVSALNGVSPLGAAVGALRSGRGPAAEVVGVVGSAEPVVSEEAVGVMLEMGYEFYSIVRALEANGWSVERAVDALGSSSVSPHIS